MISIKVRIMVPSGGGRSCDLVGDMKACPGRLAKLFLDLGGGSQDVQLRLVHLFRCVCVLFYSKKGFLKISPGTSTCCLITRTLFCCSLDPETLKSLVSVVATLLVQMFSRCRPDVLAILGQL